MWNKQPKFLTGSSTDSRIDTNFIWLPPGQRSPLHKTTFINGRYVSSTDRSRQLIFQYQANDAFHCDVIDLKDGVSLRVEVVRGWQLNLDEPSFKMTARFFIPGNEVVVESEFKVLDSEWIHEHWRTNGGATGDNFWQKTDL